MRSNIIPLRSTGQDLSGFFLVLLRKIFPQKIHLNSAVYRNAKFQGKSMRYKVCSFFIIMSLSGVAFSASVCNEAEIQFKAAIKIYKKEGGTAFMKRVLKNGPLENDTRSLSQAQSLGQIEQFFGSLETASILSTKQLGSRSCYIIGILEYQNGPAFAVANYYSGSKGVGATSMFFQTEPEQILPKEFLVQ